MTQERKDTHGVIFKPGDIVAYAAGCGDLGIDVYEYHSNTPTSIRAVLISPWMRTKDVDGLSYPEPLVKHWYSTPRLYSLEELYERMQGMFKPTPLKSCERRVVILNGATAQDYPEYYKYKVLYGF